MSTAEGRTASYRDGVSVPGDAMAVDIPDGAAIADSVVAGFDLAQQSFDLAQQLRTSDPMPPTRTTAESPRTTAESPRTTAESPHTTVESPRTTAESNTAADDTESESSSDGCTVYGFTALLTFVSDARKQVGFLEWVDEIQEMVSLFAGFVSVDTHHIPLSANDIGTSVLLRFSDEESLCAWTTSTERRDKLAEAVSRKFFSRKGHKTQLQNGGQVNVEFDSVRKFKKVLPPPKFKLWLMIWLLVFVVSGATTEAGLRSALQHDGWLQFEIALLVQLSIHVAVIMYILSPLVLKTAVGGYGVSAWLKLPRVEIHPDAEKDRYFALRVALAGLLNTANSGFTLFNPPPPPPPSDDVIHHLAVVEGKLEALNRRNTELTAAAAAASLPLGGDIAIAGLDGLPATRHATRVPSYPGAEELQAKLNAIKKIGKTCKDEPAKGPITVTILHRIRWERTEEYLQWQKEIIAIVSTFPGFISTRVMPPHGRGGLVNLYSVYVKFDTLANLHRVMVSSERSAQMAKLEPLVAAKDVSTALHRREITDVLSDTFVDQGRPVLARPPSKWKVMTLTIIALFLTAWPVAKEMPRQYVRWGVTDGAPTTFGDRMAAGAVNSGFTTFANLFGTTPLLTNFFGHWLRVPRAEYAFTRQPWKTLELGVHSTSALWLCAVVFFAGCSFATYHGKYGTQNQ